MRFLAQSEELWEAVEASGWMFQDKISWVMAYTRLRFCGSPIREENILQITLTLLCLISSPRIFYTRIIAHETFATHSLPEGLIAVGFFSQSRKLLLETIWVKALINSTGDPNKFFMPTATPKFGESRQTCSQQKCIQSPPCTRLSRFLLSLILCITSISQILFIVGSKYRRDFAWSSISDPYQI